MIPKWIEEMNRDTFRDSADINVLIEALTIAIEALESVHISLGIPLSEKERPSYEVCIMEHKIVDEALARIAALGGKNEH